MKPILTVLIATLALNASAQITLEHTYQDDNLQVFNVEGSGPMYIGLDYTTNDVTVYDKNHALVKTVALNLPPGAILYGSASYVSSKLFDGDAGVEFIYSYAIGNPPNATYGTVIMDDNDTPLMTFAGSSEYSVHKTDNGYKLLLSPPYNSTVGHRVYALPGQYTGTKKIINDDNNAEAELYPNPMQDAATIRYTLPKNVNKAVMKVYNMQGVEIRQFTVTNQFDNIIMQRSEMPAGTYTYQLVAPDMTTVSKKFIVE